jgi:hypothetical protein
MTLIPHPTHNALRRSRRGSFYSIFVSMFEFGFFRFIFFALAILVTLLLIHQLAYIDFDIRMAERNAISYNLFYSPSGFSYTDPDTGRTYPGVIDPTRLNDNVLDNAAGIAGNEHIGAQYALAPAGNPDTPIRSGVLNRAYFIESYPLAKNNVKGTDKTVLYARTFPVRYIVDPAHPEYRVAGILREEIVVREI